MNGTLIDTTTPVESGPGSNGNEGVLHRSETSFSDTVQCYTPQTPLFCVDGIRDSYSSTEDTVRVFLSLAFF